MLRVESKKAPALYLNGPPAGIRNKYRSIFSPGDYKILVTLGTRKQGINLNQFLPNPLPKMYRP